MSRKHFPPTDDLGGIQRQAHLVSHRAEPGLQVLDARVEADEVQPLERLHAGRRLQGELRQVEVGRVAVAARYADQPAVGVERPRVVEALEAVGAVLVRTAY